MCWEQRIEKLLTYKSKSIKAVDIGDYWQTALAELETLDFNVELVKAKVAFPKFDCYNLYFTSVGEARIHGKLVVPQEVKLVPGILKFHGYGHYSGDWFSQMGLASIGAAVLSIDCRGQSGISEDRLNTMGTTFKGHIVRGLLEGKQGLLYRSLFLDTVAAARVLMSLEGIDPDQISSFGYSQGGGLALVCGALESRIKKIAVAYPFLSDYQAVYESGVKADAYQEIKDYIKSYDPTHENLPELFECLSYIDIQHLVGNVKGEVLFGASLSDSTCPSFSQFAAYNKLETKKELVVYPDFGHEDLPGFMDKTLTFLGRDIT